MPLAYLMTAAELTTALAAFPPDWQVYMLAADGQGVAHIDRVEPAVVDYSEMLCCSVGEPADALGDGGEEVGNGCIVITGG